MREQNHEGGSRSREVDFGDPRVTEAWLVDVDPDLDESDRQALAEEISRQFRQSPAGVSAPEFKGELEKTQERLSWVLRKLETQESPEVRLQAAELRDRFVKDIEILKRRVDESQVNNPDT
jgi:hypothetical protein